MRKIATSLGLAALFFVGALAHDDRRIKGQDDIPVLEHHLATNKGLSSIRGSQLGSHHNFDEQNLGNTRNEEGSRLRASALPVGDGYEDAHDCFLSNHLEKPHDCSCGHDDWGCEGGHFLQE